MMTEDEIQSIRKNFRLLEGKTGQVAMLFYNRLFHLGDAIVRNRGVDHCGDPSFRTNSANRGSERSGSTVKLVFKSRISDSWSR